MKRDSIVIYRSFYEAMQRVQKRSYKKIMNAVLKYGLDGTESSLNGTELAIFLMVKPQIDANNRKFESGQKGGRPKNQDKPSESQDDEQEKPTDTQKNHNVTKFYQEKNQSETKINQDKPNDNQEKNQSEPYRNLMRNEKCNMLNEKCLKEYKQVSNLKEREITNTYARERKFQTDYDELLDDFGVRGEYREAVFRFIGHLKVNFNLVMLNDRLENMIIRLDQRYDEDIDKAKAIDDAIVKGYKRLDCECA